MKISAKLAALAAALAVAGAARAEPSVPAGAALYEARCERCHGPDAVSQTTSVPNLSGRAPFVYERFEEFKGVVRTGPNAMPAFDALSDEELCSLYMYLRSRQPGAPARIEQVGVCLAPPPPPPPPEIVAPRTEFDAPTGATTAFECTGSRGVIVSLREQYPGGVNRGNVRTHFWRAEAGFQFTTGAARDRYCRWTGGVDPALAEGRALSFRWDLTNSGELEGWRPFHRLTIDSATGEFTLDRSSGRYVPLGGRVGGDGLSEAARLPRAVDAPFAVVQQGGARFEFAVEAVPVSPGVYKVVGFRTLP